MLLEIVWNDVGLVALILAAILVILMWGYFGLIKIRDWFKKFKLGRKKPDATQLQIHWRNGREVQNTKVD